MTYLAPSLFIALWIFHSWLVEYSPWKTRTLSYKMNQQRSAWMQVMAGRELRMVDTNILGGLQSGTAFFASTSLLAIGAAFTLLNFTDTFMSISSSLPLMAETSTTNLQLKSIGLMVLFAFAFLKFSWSYRLFNYGSILVGAVPAAENPTTDTLTMKKSIEAASEMCVAAGREFNRGQRAFYIAIGYLGWFLNDTVFIITTLLVYTMLIKRQFFTPVSKLL